MLAKHALSQLSYTPPVSACKYCSINNVWDNLGIIKQPVFQPYFALLPREMCVAVRQAQAAVPNFQLDEFPRCPSAVHRRYPTMAEGMHHPNRESNLFADRLEHVTIHVSAFQRSPFASHENSTGCPAVEQRLLVLVGVYSL
jgi:hypothetical protein